MKYMRYRDGKVIFWVVLRECFMRIAIKTSKNVDYERRTVQTKALTFRMVAWQSDTECFEKGV